MLQATDILKVRILLCFLKRDAKDCTVTKIAQTMGEEKYTISRILGTLSQEGYIDKSNARNPRLTQKGKEAAEYYEERIRVSQNHLIYEGVDINNAKKDAFNWAIFNSESTMNVIRDSDERYRIKNEMSTKKKFSGAVLCRNMKDGVYEFPFLIYRENIKDGNNISWTNEVFEHPCTLVVKDGVGTIHLKVKPGPVKNPENGKNMEAYTKTLKYTEYGREIHAENHGSLLEFPASVLEFINIGKDVGHIMHGSACIKIGGASHDRNFPETQAIFTILI